MDFSRPFALFRFNFFASFRFNFFASGFLLRFTSVFSLHKICFVSHQIVCLLKSNPPLLFQQKIVNYRAGAGAGATILTSWSRSRSLDQLEPERGQKGTASQRWLKPHPRLLFIHYSLCSFNFILFFFCCYSTTSSPIPFVATVQQCTVYIQHHPLFLLLLLYSIQRHPLLLMLHQPLPFNPFLATEQPHPLFVMLLQPYPVLFSVATSNSINSSSIPFVATISSSISSVTTLFSNICYYNLILFS